LDSEDFIKGAWFFGISDLKGKSQDFDFRFLDLFRKSRGGAIDTDLDLSAQGQALGVLQFIEDSSSDIFDEALELDGLTLLTKVGAALVMRIGREKSAISGEDGKGKEAEEANDLDQGLRDFNIETFSQAIFEMSEIGLTGNMRTRDTGIEAIMFSLFFIPDSREEGFEVRELLQITKQLQKKETDWIISMASHGRIS
jgi:hypothetical protein